MMMRLDNSMGNGDGVYCICTWIWLEGDLLSSVERELRRYPCMECGAWRWFSSRFSVVYVGFTLNSVTSLFSFPGVESSMKMLSVQYARAVPCPVCIWIVTERDTELYGLHPMHEGFKEDSWMYHVSSLEHSVGFFKRPHFDRNCTKRGWLVVFTLLSWGNARLAFVLRSLGGLRPTDSSNYATLKSSMWGSISGDHWYDNNVH